MYRVACVYKEGNGFHRDAVACLYNAVKRNTTELYQFVCFTNEQFDFCKTLPLERHLDGWWNKLEMFRPEYVFDGLTIYFDLDTLIVGNIDRLFTVRGDFVMLKHFNLRGTRERVQHQYDSGVLCWVGDQSFLWNKYDDSVQLNYKGDGDYIEQQIKKSGAFPYAVQDYVNVHSYKGHCGNGKPDDAQIICFHGKPRPWDVEDQWVKDQLI